MLGCTLTNELSSPMNWAVGDQKISMKKKPHLETPGSKMCMVSLHMGPLVLNSVCSNLYPLKVLNILNGMRKALFSRGLKFGDRKWPNMITGLSKSLALRPGAIVFSSRASKIYHCPARRLP